MAQQFPMTRDITADVKADDRNDRERMRREIQRLTTAIVEARCGAALRQAIACGTYCR